MADAPRTVIAIRHVSFKLEALLRRRGCTIRYIDAGSDPLDPALAADVR